MVFPQTPKPVISSLDNQPVVISLANQKGGTMKTTGTVTLAGALGRKGKRTVIVDLDPQASLTEYFLNPADLEETMFDLIVEGKVITPIELGPNIALLPTNIDLAAAEILLPSKTNFERNLKRYLRPYAADYILIDCPPSLGVLTRNALTASHAVLIPVATEIMAKRTIPLILDQIGEVRDTELNPTLYPWKILPTLYSAREKEDNDVLAEMRATYGDLVHTQPVPRRTNYKKAVRQAVDVSDIDAGLGDLWDELADQIIQETPQILSRSAAHA